MNNADAVVGWVGLSLALVIGYGAYKNKPTFGKNGVVTQAIQTGKISSSTPKPGVAVPPPQPGEAPTPPIPTVPGAYGAAYVSPMASGLYYQPTPAPAPSAPSSPLSALTGLSGVTSWVSDTVSSIFGSLFG